MRFEIARSFILTSNYIQFGAKEIIDRFITLHVKGKRGNEDRWNEIAEKLSGISYFIAKNFFSINPLTGKTIDIESFMDFFRGSRSDVKSNIISLGIGMIRLWLGSCYQMPLRIESYDFEDEENLTPQFAARVQQEVLDFLRPEEEAKK